MLLLYLLLFVFFKQKTAYEMRISDWSSDVCSSDLNVFGETLAKLAETDRRSDNNLSITTRGISTNGYQAGLQSTTTVYLDELPLTTIGNSVKIGRASCRERVCQYV